MLAPLIEGLEVDRGAAGQLLDLALADLNPGLSVDRVAGVLKRSPGRLQRGQAPQAVRVLFLGQVEQAVGRVQVLRAVLAVGPPLDRHLAKDALKLALVALLGPPARHPLHVDHLLKALLAHRPQRQMIGQQAAQQLAAFEPELLL